MPMQHVRPQTFDLLVGRPQRRDVGRTDGSAYRQADQAECQKRPDIVKQPVLMRAAGQAVAEDTDLVSRLALLFDQVADMAEYPTHRRPEAMKDAERFCHDEWSEQ